MIKRIQTKAPKQLINVEIEKSEKEIIKEVNETLHSWHRNITQLRFIIVTLGLISIISSFAVSAFPDTLMKDYYPAVRLLSFLTGVSVSILAAFNITKNCHNARKALYHLEYHYDLYKIGEISIAELIKAKKAGEDTFGTINFKADVIKPSKEAEV